MRWCCFFDKQAVWRDSSTRFVWIRHIAVGSTEKGGCSSNRKDNPRRYVPGNSMYKFLPLNYIQSIGGDTL